LLARVNAEFSDSDLPWRVDLLDWATTGEAFRNQIRQYYCVAKKAGKHGADGGILP
jgi:hypothetical protein